VIAEAHAKTRQLRLGLASVGKAANVYLLSGQVEDSPVNGDSIRESVATSLLRVYRKLKQLQEELDLLQTDAIVEHDNSPNTPMMRAVPLEKSHLYIQPHSFWGERLKPSGLVFWLSLRQRRIPLDWRESALHV
jgi:hypothetical protein